MIRNVLLAVPAVLVVAYGAGEAVDTWLEARSPAELVTASAGIAAVVVAALCLRLWPEKPRRGREAARLQPSGEPGRPGLPIGASAPNFALASVDGETITLSALLARGKPLVLLFLSTGCPSCVTMLPDLARWQSTLDDRLTISIVTAGATPEVRRLSEEHGVTNVLVQPDHEVFDAYRAMGTPSGVIVTPDARIASQTTQTRTMLETLIRQALHRAPTTPGQAPVSLTGGSLVVHHRSSALGRPRT